MVKKSEHDKPFIVTTMRQTDEGFWQLMGPIFASREIRRSLGMAPASEESYVWAICTHKGLLCGFGALVPKRAELKHAYVYPAFRKKGVYRNLIAARIDAAKQLGLKILNTTATDESLPILVRAGFKKIGNRGKYHMLRLAF